MARQSYQNLRRKMTAKQLAESEAQSRVMMAEMLLAEIRKSVGLTQEDLAAAMGIQQPSLSKLENQDDMQISTLRRLVEGLGGSLEIIAHLPKGDVRISQFQGSS